MNEDKTTPLPTQVSLSEGLGPLVGPLFLLHCGAVFDGERDDWDTEANSGAAVDALADQRPGETLGLYALSPEDVAAVNAARKEMAWKALRRLDLCRCDHNEYCGHCYPVEFRPGGVWGGPNVGIEPPYSVGSNDGLGPF